MKMREITYSGQSPVDGYGPGGFRVGGDWHEGAVLLSPSGVSAAATPLAPETFAPLVEMAEDVDVVLIGQGAEIAALPKRLRVMLEEAGIGYEIMATPPACRTYNVLLAEERRVAAVLLPV